MDALLSQMVLFRYAGAKNGFETATFSVSFEQEGKRWVGTCLELGTSAYGDSFEEAREDLRDAVLLTLAEIQRLGREGEFFDARGVKVESHPLPKETEAANTWAHLATADA